MTSIKHGLVLLLLLAAGSPGYALPKFAREYRLECRSCHSIPPRLNSFGEAFQANFFQWPGDDPPARRSGTEAVPVSAVAELSYTDDRTEDRRSTQFRNLYLFFAGGLRAGGRQGGYLFQTLAATNAEGEKGGNLEEAFVALPVAGRRAQWAVTLGQTTPLFHQWWHHTRLLSTGPTALALRPFGSEPEEHHEEEEDHHAVIAAHPHRHGAEGFSFADHQAGVRLDYFSGRGQGTADGDYLMVGVPFDGRLALNRDARLGNARGIYAHAFRRWRQNTLGAFAYTHAGSHLGGVIGSRQFGESASLVGIGALGDDEGHTRRLSLEGEYLVNPRLAAAARLEAIGGAENDVGTVAAVTYYPLDLPVLRLTLETIQRKGNRSVELSARVQF
jgi:hypothetical protein